MSVKSVCRNYNAIVNCEFLDDDLFSKRLVDYYKKLSVSIPDDNEGMLRKLAKFDHVMRKYVEDYNFSKKLQNSIDVTRVVEDETDLSGAVVEYVIEYSDRYDEDKDEIITNTRWI